MNHEQNNDQEHADTGLTPDELRAKYGDQGEHPQFIKSDWRYEVSNDDTNLAYWEWVIHKVEAWDPSDDQEDES